MGQIAAKTVIDQIEGNEEYVAEIAIEPEFVVRASTGIASSITRMPDMGSETPSLIARKIETANTD
jgi:LacI family transcriptional regulator